MQRIAMAVAGLAALMGAAPAAAHPHAWIDLTVTLAVDSAGQVTALEQSWRFDEFYTLFVLDGGLGPEHETDPSGLDRLMHQNIANLADYDYFTEIADAAGPIGFAGVEAVQGRLADGRLVMDFTLLLDRPADAVAGPVDYAIFDPSYYVEMRHRAGTDSVATAGPADCTVALDVPEPEPEWLMLAAAVDVGGATDTGLGRLFADRVSVTCRRDG